MKSLSQHYWEVVKHRIMGPGEMGHSEGHVLLLKRT